MLTPEERRQLQSLLDHAVAPQEALSIDALEGYLFGVLITPEVTTPSEWFRDIFGSQMAEFPTQQEADRCFAALQNTYDRLNSRRLVGELDFPETLGEVTEANRERIQQLALGLDKALALRAWLWLSDEALEREEQTPEEEAVMHSLLVVLAVGHPEQLPQLFESLGPDPQSQDAAWRDLAEQLPLAATLLQRYAEELEEAAEKADPPD